MDHWLSIQVHNYRLSIIILKFIVWERQKKGGGKLWPSHKENWYALLKTWNPKKTGSFQGQARSGSFLPWVPMIISIACQISHHFFFYPTVAHKPVSALLKPNSTSIPGCACAFPSPGSQPVALECIPSCILIATLNSQFQLQPILFLLHSPTLGYELLPLICFCLQILWWTLLTVLLHMASSVCFLFIYFVLFCFLI